MHVEHPYIHTPRTARDFEIVGVERLQRPQSITPYVLALITKLNTGIPGPLPTDSLLDELRARHLHHELSWASIVCVLFIL